VHITAEIFEAIRGVYNMTLQLHRSQIAPWPKFWILVFNQDVLRPIVYAASSNNSTVPFFGATRSIERISYGNVSGWLAGWVGGCPSQPVLYQND